MEPIVKAAALPWHLLECLEGSPVLRTIGLVDKVSFTNFVEPLACDAGSGRQTQRRQLG